MSIRREFIVRVSHDYEYKVVAESADEAEQIVEEGEAGNGECTGSNIHEVVSADKEYVFDAEDERTKCVCGHLMLNGYHTGLWSGAPGSRDNPHPKACNSIGCWCLSPIEDVAEPAENPPAAFADALTTVTPARQVTP